MGDFYPEPPHLIVALYCECPEGDTFRLLNDVIIELGGQPANAVEVAPADQEFELLSDLTGHKRILSVDSDLYGELIAGEDTKTRVLKAGFTNRQCGRLVVEYLQRVGPGRHPVAVSTGSGSLGIPDFLWTTAQRQNAYSMGEWSRELLETVCSRWDVLYGAIGVEFSMPTPWQIKTKRPRLPTEIFVSRQLAGQGGLVEEGLRRAFVDGELLEWNSGLFLSGWAPFNANHVTVTDPSKTAAAALSALRLAFESQD